MSIKLNSIISLVSSTPAKDAEGFSVPGETVVARIRAYKEDRHGSVAWKNRAAFSTATALFRFRKIPGVVVDTSLYIVCGGERYRIVSVEDVSGRGLYLEILAEAVMPNGKSDHPNA